MSTMDGVKSVLPWVRVKELCQKHILPHVPELYSGKVGRFEEDFGCGDFKVKGSI